jgi:hypothetical protein
MGTIGVIDCEKSHMRNVSTKCDKPRSGRNSGANTGGFQLRGDRAHTYHDEYREKPSRLTSCMPQEVSTVLWHQNCSSPLQRRGFRCQSVKTPASEEAGHSRQTTKRGVSTGLQKHSEYKPYPNRAETSLCFSLIPNSAPSMPSVVTTLSPNDPPSPVQIFR